MTALDGAEILVFEDAAQWEAWLAGNHAREKGVWLRVAKKHSGKVSVTVAEALQVALCYGWIDGTRKSLDEAYFLQKYSRRRARSSWSRVNVDHAAALVAAGRMRAPGLEQIDAAKADGRWDRAYESQKNVTVPDDLAVALEKSDQARSAFDALDKTHRYLVILPLLKAPDPARRADLLRKAIADLETAGE